MKKKKFGSAYKIPGKCVNCNKPISYLEGTMPICAQCARRAFISEEEAFKHRVAMRNTAKL